MTARRIQHDLRQARCGCGTVHAAARPGGMLASAVSIGPNLRALAVYLVVFQHVPIERCARLISDVTGAEVSAGFVHSCLARAAEVVADVVKLIKTLITAAHVAGFDETTLRRGAAGTKEHVLAAVTERYSVFSSGADPGVVPRLRDPAGLRPGGGLRPVSELLPQRLGEYHRPSGVPGSLDPRLRGRCRVLAADYPVAVRRGQAWVAAVDGEVVGFIILISQPGYLLPENVAVLPAAQGRGIGARLLALAEDRARALHVPEIRHHANAAMIENPGLYPRHGVHPDPPGPTGRLLPCLLPQTGGYLTARIAA